MRITTEHTLQDVLNDHEKWLENSNTGSRANLRGADLRAANLSGTGLFQFNGGRHTALAIGDTIQIGCHSYTVSQWLVSFKTIGNEAGYTAAEIEDYGDFIKWYAKKIK